MAFSDLQIKACAESGVIAAHKNMAKLSLFTKSYAPAVATVGYSVAVPVYDLSAAADFVAGTNDFGTGTNEVNCVLAPLDKHYVRSQGISDMALAETGIAWAKDTATALADSLTRSVNAYAFGLINSTNCTLSSSFDATAKTIVANLYAVAEENDIPVDRAVVVLNPTQYAKVLGLIGDVSIYGDKVIQTGVLHGLYGFKGFVCSSNLPSGTVGAVICDEAIAIVNRWNAPQTPDAYPAAFAATDEDGFTIGYRRFMSLSTGTDIFAADVLFGVTLVQPNRIVRLV